MDWRQCIVLYRSEKRKNPEKWRKWERGDDADLWESYERKEPLWSFLHRAMKPLRNDKNSMICDRFSEAQRMLHGLLQAPWKSIDDRWGRLAMKVGWSESLSDGGLRREIAGCDEQMKRKDSSLYTELMKTKEGRQPLLDPAESEYLQEDYYRGGGNDSCLGFIATRMENEAGVRKQP